MRFFTRRLFSLIALFLLVLSSFAQERTNRSILERAAAVQAIKYKALTEQLQLLARQKGWDLVRTQKNGGISILAGIDDAGMPLYLSTENNITAAATIGTNKLWPGAISGLNLSGASASVKDKLAIWDGGKVRGTHAELVGRVLQKDGAVSISDHSTHVAGTLIASGVNTLAKGMSFGQQELLAYDFNNDVTEMLTAAPDLLVSNHSYGFNAGWNFNETQNRWEFLGQAGTTEDYKFGYYSSQAQTWDSIAYNAPYYLIVKSAGNNRDVNGPAVGQPYWRYDASNTMVNAGNRPAGISSNDSYDILSLNSTAKNILLVGAINPIAAGYGKPEDVQMSSFSSWGPTDDGRIKPDVVADGVNLLSSVGTSDNAYATFSGTSMSSPNASGSLLLLQEYYAQLHSGSFMRSATLKGLVIHTADEAGTSPGPDYRFGWGLINMAKAAAIITANNSTQLIQENTLNSGGSFSLPVIASGNGTITATISWTDPKAVVESIATALNNNTPKLVNDLDIVIKKGATVYRPWILNPANPSAIAATGDNTLDNVEKIEIPDAVPGAAYTIEVTHKNVLQRGSQAYSLIVSGVGGQAYCASSASNTGGARIDSVSFADVRNKNVAGCTSYNSFTNITGSLQPAQSVPLFVRLNSCDASSTDKIIKVYIDANNDGDFADNGENVATSSVINGNGDFATNFTVPAGLSTGKFTLLRIVMQETSAPGAISPCGTYAKGETQDYRIFITNPGADLGVTALVNPVPTNCANTEQYITVNLRNYGSEAKSSIPVSVLVKQGATTIANITESYPGTIPALSETAFTLQTPVNLAAGTTYTFTASTALPGDQNSSNDQLVTSISTATVPAPAGTAEICTSTALLKATNADPLSTYFWYNSSSATTPIAAGANAQTNDIPGDKTYYLATGAQGKVGLPSKNNFPIPGGGYQENGGNYMKYTAEVPLVLENVRLFTKYPGTVTLIAADIGTITGNTYTYSQLASKTIDVYATNPNPTAGAADATAADAADEGAVFNVDLPLPAGSHVIIVTAGNGATIFRNNNVTGNPYPFTLPNLISLTGNSATQAGNPNFFQGFYYYLYDLKVRTNGCSSNRSAVIATTAVPPVISLTGNLLSSSAGTGNQWYLNNAPIAGATNPDYTVTSDGIYTVQVTDAAGCSLFSNEINFATTPVTNVDPAEIGLTVGPNPSPGAQFTLQLETRTKADLSISLLNTAGQKVYGFTIPAFIGKLSRTVTAGKIAAGVYYLQVLHDKKRYIRKIIVTN